MKALFKVGDKVVCVNSKDVEESVTEGKQYTVKAIEFCRKCGAVSVDVGCPFDSEKYEGCECGHTEYDNICWIYQNRFVPLQTDRALESEIFEALKGHKILN